MRATIYSEKGSPVVAVESALTPAYGKEGVLYVEYDSFGAKVLAGVEGRPPGKEAEEVAAVKQGEEVAPLGETPEELAESLGAEVEEAGRAQNRPHIVRLSALNLVRAVASATSATSA